MMIMNIFSDKYFLLSLNRIAREMIEWDVIPNGVNLRNSHRSSYDEKVFFAENQSW